MRLRLLFVLSACPSRTHRRTIHAARFTSYEPGVLFSEISADVRWFAAKVALSLAGGMDSHRSPFCLLALAMDAGNGTFLDHAATRPNLRRACRHVVGNRGCPGVDGMTVQQLATAWPQLENEISRTLHEGAYEPAAIRRCTIPKPGGKGLRVLGIPSVLDRVIQQAVAQPLSALLDEGFSPHSFGFRPGRCAHDALRQAAHFVENGLNWVLHLDLAKFFDHAPHDLVLARLRERVDDPRLHELVQRCLSVPFACGNHHTTRLIGLPQGSPLSPLFANLLLDGLDQRLFDSGFHFCRYADDICLYFPSALEAREAFAMIAPWIEVGLKLRINREKTRIVPVEQDVFLGYRLCSRNGRVGFAPSTASCQRLRAAVRRFLDKNRTGNPREIIGEAVSPLLNGWTQYFSLTENRRLLSAVDRVIIFELRRWLWRRVRDPRRRARVLIKRGVRAEVAWMLVRGAYPTGCIVESEPFKRAYPLEWLRQRGWVACQDFVWPRATLLLRFDTAQSEPAAFIASTPPNEIEDDCRIAARDCALYEWQGLVGAP